MWNVPVSVLFLESGNMFRRLLIWPVLTTAPICLQVLAHGSVYQDQICKLDIIISLLLKSLNPKDSDMTFVRSSYQVNTRKW